MIARTCTVQYIHTITQSHADFILLFLALFLLAMVQYVALLSCQYCSLCMCCFISDSWQINDEDDDEKWRMRPKCSFWSLITIHFVWHKSYYKNLISQGQLQKKICTLTPADGSWFWPTTLRRKKSYLLQQKWWPNPQPPAEKKHCRGTGFFLEQPYVESCTRE